MLLLLLLLLVVVVVVVVMAVGLFSLQYVLLSAVTSSSRPSAAPRVPTDLIYCTASVCVCVCVCVCVYIYIYKVKVKVTLEQATKDQTGSRGIAVLFH